MILPVAAKPEPARLDAQRVGWCGAGEVVNRHDILEEGTVDVSTELTWYGSSPRVQITVCTTSGRYEGIISVSTLSIADAIALREDLDEVVRQAVSCGAAIRTAWGEVPSPQPAGVG